MVTTTSDTPVPGKLSLREAIDLSNSNPGPDTINFAFPDLNTPGVIDYDPIFQTWKIQPATALPTITDQVFIDGYTQRVIHAGGPTDEVQSVAITGATAGTFTLTFRGQTTSPIPFNASAALIQASLENLSTIGVGNILAGGGPLPDTAVSMTFIGRLAVTDVPQITADGSGLVGGTVTAVTTTNGVPASIISTPNDLTVGSDAHIRVIIDGSNAGGATGLTISSTGSRVRGLVIDGFGVGVHIVGPAATGNLIQGNAIGEYVGYIPVLDGGGSALLGVGNSQQGVLIDAPTNNTVGGAAPEAHNTIAGNGLQGVQINPDAQGSQVIGNLIGVAQQDAGLYYLAGNGQEGVLVLSSSNAIGGPAAGATNIISANGSYGIRVSGVDATRNRIQGNDIGTDTGGTLAFGQGVPGNLRDGILIEDAPNTLIGGVPDAVRGLVPRNVVSGNFGAGIRITGVTATGTLIEGNFIGVTGDSSAPLPNAQEGVDIFSANNTVGGTIVGTGNVISANLRGVVISGANAINNLIQDNFIGTDAKGVQDFGNANEGIWIENASGNTIGGTVVSNSTSGGNIAGSLNVISGNNVGVRILGSTSKGNVVLGNNIGTDVTGLTDLGNSQQGVLIDQAPMNTIGGTTAAARNVISANHWGLTITGATAFLNLVEGNWIGTDDTGTLALGNEVDGVLINQGASSNFIGTTAAGAANAIAFNVEDGVRVEDATSVGNAILSDRFFGNQGLPIDLVPPPVGPGGPNNLQAAPVLTSVASNVSGSVISGTLTSTPNATFRIQFFASTPNNLSLQGTLLGMTTVTTNASGTGTFAAQLPVTIPLGEAVNATATSSTGDTSEFSASLSESVGTVQFAAASVSVNQVTGSVTLTVTRAGGSGGYFQISYNTQNLTAMAGVDYRASTGTLTFNPAQLTATITIAILADPSFSPARTFQVVLSNPVGAATLGAPAVATVTIVQTNLPGSISFSSSSYFVNEADGRAVITVTRTSSGGLVTVPFTTSDGTAKAGVDYAATSGVLTFNPGETVQTFQIQVFNNSIDETTKSLSILLGPPTGGASLGTPATATLTIQDNFRNTTGPSVVDIHFLEYRAQTTGIVIHFSEPLNQSTAENLLNYGYSVRAAGRDGRFGTRDDLLIGLKSATYDGRARSVTLSLARPLRHNLPLLLMINAATSVPGGVRGLSDLFGNLLDSTGTGVPGGIYSTVLIDRERGSATAAAPQSEARAATRKPLPVMSRPHLARAAAANAHSLSSQVSHPTHGRR